MKIGFIGFGEASYFMSLGLREEKAACDIYAYDKMMAHTEMGSVIKSRAKEAGVELLSTAKEVISKADVVIASVQSKHTLEVCKSVVDDLKPGQIYADVSASTAKTKEKVWELLKDKKILFADAAMMGPLPLNKHKVPISASGNGAQAFYDAMTPFGMDITIESDRAGDASAMKLIRSIFMKGLGALMMETTQAAMRCDLEEQVVASIGKTIDGIPFEETLSRMAVGIAVHGKRRADEVRGSVEMCEELGIPSDMSKSAILWHERMAAYNLGPKYSANRPKSWREVVADIISLEEGKA